MMLDPTHPDALASLAIGSSTWLKTCGDGGVGITRTSESGYAMWEVDEHGGEEVHVMAFSLDDAEAAIEYGRGLA